MGKRKRSEEENLDHIERKIQKLEKELSRHRRHQVEYSCSIMSDNESTEQTTGEDAQIEPEDWIDNDQAVVTEPQDSSIKIGENNHVNESEEGCTNLDIPNCTSLPKPSSPLPGTSSSIRPQTEEIVCASAEAGDVATVEESIETTLDSELLEILGEDPTSDKKYGKEIQSALAVRLEHIVANGLSKENRKEIIEKYCTPSNCLSLDAPMLNPEMTAAVPETILKKDRGIEAKQKQICSVISALAQSITVLMSRETKDTETLKTLMDASRLLCDSQHADSVIRRNFILFNLKKELKDQITQTKINKYLFGTNLAETIKTAKTITKSGAELKSTHLAPLNKITNKRVDNTSMRPTRNLNWKAPPQNRNRPQGNQRKEPTYRNQSQRGPPLRPSQQRPAPTTTSRTYRR